MVGRHKIISEARRSNKVSKDQKAKGWQDKKMRKECDKGDKLLMNKIHKQPSKESSQKVLGCNHAPITMATIQGK